VLKSVFRKPTSGHILSWMPVVPADHASSRLAVVMSQFPRGTLQQRAWSLYPWERKHVVTLAIIGLA
jgi:hypothetical protein